MNLEDIRLNEISQTQKNKYCRSHLYVESESTELTEAESRMVQELATREMGRKLVTNFKLQGE